jgi:hypothetical protein
VFGELVLLGQRFRVSLCCCGLQCALCRVSARWTGWLAVTEGRAGGRATANLSEATLKVEPENKNYIFVNCSVRNFPNELYSASLYSHHHFTRNTIATYPVKNQGGQKIRGTHQDPFEPQALQEKFPLLRNNDNLKRDPLSLGQNGHSWILTSLPSADMLCVMLFRVKKLGTTSSSKLK